MANVKERLTANKRVMQKSDMEMLSLKKLNDIEGKEQYQVKISNGIAALGNVDDGVDIARA
jgi:hypothetical protein